ncbi:dihydroorotate oxidase [Ignavigranum ruoffiae]|uniref:dihydroorotate oxidase n=1 Tax=Ignavigranum ruoffiae TaxID=89093 RepID=UPI003AFF80D4
MTNISTTIGKVNFDNCLMNAAGILCMSQAELDSLKDSQAATFVTKTATLQARPGNPEPRYYAFGDSSINSMGLPNLGIDFYLDYLKHDARQAQRFLSIAPIQPDDLPQLIEKINQSHYQGMIELNLSCPNIPGKPQTAYDFEQTASLLDQIFSLSEHAIGVKLPPFFDLVHFDQMADLLNRYPLTFVTCINSLGNGLVINELSVAIKPKQGFGGQGGSIVKPTALANVHAFRQRLKDEIHVIGAGGVITGRDVFEHILCGADMVQIGSQLLKEGPEIFPRLQTELIEEMHRYGYQSLADFRNQLKYI